MKKLLSRRAGKLLAVFVMSLGLLGLLLNSGPPSSRAASTDQVQPLFYNEAGISSTLTIQNVGSSVTTVTVTFIGSSSGETVNYKAALSAFGSVSLTPADVFGLEADTYGVAIQSTPHPIESVVRHTLRSRSDNLAAIRGIDERDTALNFAAFTENDGLSVLNSSLAQTATVTASFYGTGGLITTALRTIAPAGSANFFDDSLDLPNDFVGWTEITADQPLIGLFTQRGASDNVFESVGPTESATEVTFPRAFKGVEQGGVSRTSRLFVANTGNSQTAVTVTFYSTDGAVVDTNTLDLEAKSGAIIDLATQSALTKGQTYVVAANAANPLLIAEVPPTSGPVADTADYKGMSGSTINLPRVVKRTTNYSVINLQNPNAVPANVVTAYYDESGQTVYSATTITIAANGLLPLNLMDVPQVGDTFNGSAVVQSDQPLQALVDEYQTGRAMVQTIPVTPSQGITVTTTDGVLTIEADPNALPANAVDLRYRFHGITPTVSIISGLPSSKIALAFSVELVDGSGDLITETISPPLRLSVTYSQTLVNQLGIDETELAILFFDETGSVWSGTDINNLMVNTATNRISWSVPHLTEFVAIEDGIKRVYLPLVEK